MPKNDENTFKTLYQSPVIRMVLALAGITLVASVLLGGCERAYVEGGRLSFSGTDLAGAPVSLADARFYGKVVVVELWGLWCPVCLSSLPALQDLHARYATQGLEVLAVEFAEGIPTDAYLASLRSVAHANGFAFTIAQAGSVGAEGGVFPELKSFDAYPTIVVIGRDGTVRHVQSGYHPSDAQLLDRTIAELLSETVDQQ